MPVSKARLLRPPQRRPRGGAARPARSQHLPARIHPDVFPASRRPEPDSRTSQEASGAPAAPAPASSPEASRIQAASAAHPCVAPAPASAVSSGSVPRPNPEERRRPNRSLSLVRGCSVLPERRAPPAPSFAERLRARILRQRGLLPKRPCGCTPDPLSGVKPCGRTVSPRLLCAALRTD